MYYFFDTSVVTHGKDHRNYQQYPRAIRGQGKNDHRFGVVKFEEEKGYSVSVYPPSSNYYGWSNKYRFDNIQ